MNQPPLRCYNVSALAEDEFLFACRTMDAITTGQLVTPGTTMATLSVQVDGYETKLRFRNQLIHAGMIALREEMSMWDDWAFISFCTRWHAANDALDRLHLKTADLGELPEVVNDSDVEEAVYRVASRVPLDNDGKIPIPELVRQCRDLLCRETASSA